MRKKTDFLFIFSLVGIGLNFIEIVLKLFNRSICEKDSCKIVSESVRLGDTILVISGMLVFILLSFLIFIQIKKQLNIIDYIIDALLIVSLSGEGFLVGFQVFRVKEICIFCISIFSLFLLLSIIRLLNKRYLILIGYCSFLLVFSLMYLIIPPFNFNKLNTSKYVLYYEKNCPHCEKVLDFLNKNNIKIEPVLAEKEVEVLKAVGILGLPTLVIRENYKISFISGEKPIIDYFKNSQSHNKGFKIKSGFCTFGTICE